MKNKIPKAFINKIKENKKYSSISNEIVIKEIENYMRKYQIDRQDVYDDKFAIKVIRKELHRLYSSYQTKGKKKRDQLLKDLDIAIKQHAPESQVLGIIKTLLSITLSTIERLPHYKKLYKDIFKITGKPKSIVDLGAGLNPLSFPLTNLPKSTAYHSYDIDTEDITFLNKYFKVLKISGEANILDVRDINKLKMLPKTDIIFMFKLYDLIVPKAKKQKKLGEEIINILKNKANYLVVSFATKTLTRKSMKLPRRIGFEMMLDRNQLKYELVETDNEIYYVCSNK